MVGSAGGSPHSGRQKPGADSSCGRSRFFLGDGIPYRQFWGESADGKQIPPPRYPLLRPEDEDEVERMFQRLKSVGRLDEK
jgi:hypothetical protein